MLVYSKQIKEFLLITPIGKVQVSLTEEWSEKVECDPECWDYDIPAEMQEIPEIEETISTLLNELSFNIKDYEVVIDKDTWQEAVDGTL